MGGCILSSYKNREMLIPEHDQLAYYRQIRFYITMKSTPNFANQQQSFEIFLDPPEQVQAKSVRLNDKLCFVSCCVLPGADPWTEVQKPCQDACLFEHSENSMLVGVYDGHGKNGRDVVAFCKDFIAKNYETPTQSVPQFLTELTKKCDKALLSQNRFDVSLSGTTQILAYFTGNTLYLANVGDSRAFLATRFTDCVAEECYEDDSAKTLQRIRRQRAIPGTDLRAVVLTKSHVPKDEEEYARILACDGRVQRLVQNGKPFGPYRVWCSDSNRPGLAMSRSLGDRVATGIGVISTPNVRAYEINPSSDGFVVIATDGIWNVMSTREVKDFVQAYRVHALIEVDSAPERVTPSTTCIAHLLCEEARMRWLAIVEKERVPMDDIACVVLEFNKKPPGKLRRMEATLHRHVSSRKVVPLVSQAPAIEASNFRGLDGLRASNVQDSNDDLEGLL